MSVLFFATKDGVYASQCDSDFGLAQGWIEVPTAPECVTQVYNFKTKKWGDKSETVAEAQAYLDRTDHKFYIGYVPKAGEDLDATLALRNEKREFIRANE